MTSPRWSEISVLVMHGVYGENGGAAKKYELPSMSEFTVFEFSVVDCIPTYLYHMTDFPHFIDTSFHFDTPNANTFKFSSPC